MTQKASLFRQAVALSVVGLVLSSIMYSAWFQGCCMDRLRNPIGIATFPAILFAMVIGGGVHSATALHYTIGLVAELLGVWGIFRFLRRIWSKRKLQLIQLGAGPEPKK
jgi:hypothetical protein